MVAKITQHWLEETGLCPGMRVLDVGSGVGDVALLVARMVGAAGEVTCVDMDRSALDTAQQRLAEEGRSNLVFHAGDFHGYKNERAFDAVVGRCVLLHQKDPLSSLVSVARHVRAGGIVAFQEPWFSRGFSYPKAPRFEEVMGWLHRTMQASGFDVEIGLSLSSLFVSAGLPRPQLTFEMLVDGGPDTEIYAYCVDTVRSLLPRMEQLGITSSAVAQVNSLTERLRREAAALGTVAGVMPLMGAWCRKP